MNKKGVLLVNLGTPDSVGVPDVRKYLREFLMDDRVIDIPFFSRWLLVNLIIAPFRAPKSAKEYEKLFVERGSPLKFYTEDLRDLLQQSLGESFYVVYGMRYQNPSIAAALSDLQKQHVSSIHVIPLFPQYASATTGSVIDKVMELTRKWQVLPEFKFTSQFFKHPLFLKTIELKGKKMMEKTKYDHFVFSYHGLPERQIHKASVDQYCALGACCDSYEEKNQYCYRAQCFHTTRLLADILGLKPDQFTVCFQSRLGKDPWIQPYTENVLHELAEKGIKKVLAFSPAFVSDCLETTIEVGELYQEQFIEAGGQQWDLVESLNTDPNWVACLHSLVEQ